jgi:hypothetical protein
MAAAPLFINLEIWSHIKQNNLSSLKRINFYTDVLTFGRINDGSIYFKISSLPFQIDNFIAIAAVASPLTYIMKKASFSNFEAWSHIK